MKEKELREAANCFICGKPFGHTGLPLFWRVTIQRFGVDVGAVNRQTGLTMMLGGNALLASVMGPDEELAKPLGEAINVTLCETCALEDASIAQIVEIANDQRGEE
jgi:hypothetical protein